MPCLPCRSPGEETAVLIPSKPRTAELSRAHGPRSPLPAPSLPPQGEEEDPFYGASHQPAARPTGLG